ncbi:integrase arm-type DNA-binding domain-containing protein [Sphingomonas sp. MJ1 (PH-R8)]|uniref:tyrosine-type recombinase/integrase n=1 Tax=Sphingomonas sp. MJ1 (PH-R8) TaxID=3112950 RepID=UPI003A8608DF
MAKDLTTATVKNAKARPAKSNPSGPLVRTEIPDGKCRGLFLVVQVNGAKSWALRYRFDGKPKKLTIGPVLDGREVSVADLPLGEPHTLAEARVAADRARLEVAHGRDPTANAVVTERARMTVADAADRYLAFRRAEKRNRTVGETERQFNSDILPVIGQRPVADITDDEAREPVKRATAKGSPKMANRLHATLSKFFKWCAAKDQKFIAESPYSGFDKPHDETSRDRVLSWDELAAVWRASAELGDAFGPIVRLLILTGQRRSEVAGIREGELDRARRLWTIPPERAKNGKRSIVPLTGPALAEIDAVTRRIGTLGLLFTRTGKTPVSGFTKAKDRLDEAAGLGEAWRLHDLRRTFSTGLEVLGVPLQVAEALLNHTAGSKAGVAGVYARHEYMEEKRHAMTAWGRFVMDVVNDDSARDAFSRLEDTRPVRAAIHGDADGWEQCAAALRGGEDGWRDYLHPPVEVAA